MPTAPIQHRLPRTVDCSSNGPPILQHEYPAPVQRSTALRLRTDSLWSTPNRVRPNAQRHCGKRNLIKSISTHLLCFRASARTYSLTPGSKLVTQCAAVRIYRALISDPPHLNSSCKSLVLEDDVSYCNNAIQGYSNRSVMFPLEIFCV